MHFSHAFVATLLATSVLFTQCQSKKTADEGQTAQSADTTGRYTPEATTMKVPEFSDVKPEVRAQIGKVLSAYLTVKNGLVEDEPAQAKQGAQQLITALSGFKSDALPADQKAFYTENATMLQEDAEQISTVSELGHQRDYLAMLSEHTYALVKAFNANEATLYHQYCPMAMNNKGAFWLSEKEEIRNPYFGDEMLECGQTKETLRTN